jgi:hypothetical protein
MEPTQSSETLAYQIQTPGKFPEDHIRQLQHGESLKDTYGLFNKTFTVVVGNEGSGVILTSGKRCYPNFR